MGAQGISVTPLRYGRVPVMTVSSQVSFTAGDFVCKDDTAASYVIGNMITPCPLGESIGVAVGDYNVKSNLHLVDLVPEASVSGAVSQGIVLQFTCGGAVGALTQTTYLNGQQCSTTANAVEFTLPYQSGSDSLKNMYVNYNTAGIAGDAVTLYVDNMAITVICNPTPAGQCTDLVRTASITGGHTYSVRAATQAGSTLNTVLVTLELQ